MMRKLIYIFLAIFILTNSAYSQIDEFSNKLSEIGTNVNDSTPKWQTGGIITTNFSQASFTNWSSGG